MIANPLCSKDKGENNFKVWLPVIFAVITGYLLWMQNVLQSSSEKDAVLVVIIISSVFFAYVQIRISSTSTSLHQDSSNDNDLTGHKKRDSFSRKVSLQLKHFSSKVLKDTTKVVRIKTILILIILLIVIVYYMLLVVILLLIVLIILNHKGE